MFTFTEESNTQPKESRQAYTQTTINGPIRMFSSDIFTEDLVNINKVNTKATQTIVSFGSGERTEKLKNEKHCNYIHVKRKNCEGGSNIFV